MLYIGKKRQVKIDKEYNNCQKYPPTNAYGIYNQLGFSNFACETNYTAWVGTNSPFQDKYVAWQRPILLKICHF